MKSLDTTRLISILIPVFNESGNIDRAYEAVVGEFEKIGGRYRFEIIFTDNHSTDNTEQELRALAAREWDPLESTCRHASLSIL